MPDTPALMLGADRSGTGPWLAVADLHLGLGATAERPAGPPGGTAEEIALALLEAAHSQRAAGIVVAGDTKHPIVGTPPALRPVLFDFFSELLSEGLQVELILGNHDGDLERHLPREVKVHPATGLVRGNVGIFHGHRWPSEAVLKAPCLVTGHLHPGFRFAPTAEHPDGKRRCWVRAALPPDTVTRRRPAAPGRGGSQELVVLPAFNPLAGAEALNRERPSRGRSFLFRRFLAGRLARAYLLDGTDLGEIPTPQAPPTDRPAEAARARKAR